MITPLLHSRGDRVVLDSPEECGVCFNARTVFIVTCVQNDSLEHQVCEACYPTLTGCPFDGEIEESLPPLALSPEAIENERQTRREMCACLLGIGLVVGVILLPSSLVFLPHG